MKGLHEYGRILAKQELTPGHMDFKHLQKTCKRMLFLVVISWKTPYVCAVWLAVVIICYALDDTVCLCHILREVIFKILGITGTAIEKTSNIKIHYNGESLGFCKAPPERKG